MPCPTSPPQTQGAQTSSCFTSRSIMALHVALRSTSSYFQENEKNYISDCILGAQVEFTLQCEHCQFFTSKTLPVELFIDRMKLRTFPSSPNLLKDFLIIKYFYMPVNVVVAVFPLYPVDMMNQLSNVEPVLLTWDKSHLAMVHNNIYVYI